MAEAAAMRPPIHVATCEAVTGQCGSCATWVSANGTPNTSGCRRKWCGRRPGKPARSAPAAVDPCSRASIEAAIGPRNVLSMRSPTKSGVSPSQPEAMDSRAAASPSVQFARVQIQHMGAGLPQRRRRAAVWRAGRKGGCGLAGPHASTATRWHWRRSGRPRECRISCRAAYSIETLRCRQATTSLLRQVR